MIPDFTFTLEFLAAVAYARSLWEEPLIKVKVFEACDSRSYESDYNDYNREKEMKAVTKMLVDEVYKKNLPESICINVVHIIKSMGKKILFWAEYLKEEMHLKIRHPDAIYWTNIGIIDQTKIFQKCVSDMLTKETYAVCDMACRCAQVEFIESNFEEIKTFFSDSRFNYGLHSHFIASTLLHVGKSSEDFKWSKNQINPENQPELKNLLRLSIEKGCDVAVKHYFEKMNVIDQEDSIISSAVKCVEMYTNWRNRSKNHIKEKLVEILIFFVSKMSENQIQEFLTSRKSSVFLMFMSVWPIQEFFIPLFNLVKDSLTGVECVEILGNILELMKPEFYPQIKLVNSIGVFNVLMISGLQESFNVQLTAADNFYFDTFKVFWHSFTKSCKIELTSDNHLWNTEKFCEIIKLLFGVFDLKLLKLVINDKILENQRDEFIKKGNSKFKTLVFEENFDLLDKFIEEIFCTDVEKENFKLSLNFYDDLISCKKFDVVEKLITWQLNSNEDRLKFINSRIDCKSVCQKLIEDNQYEDVDLFLSWVYKIEEEKENFKNIFRSDDYIREKVYDLWINNFLTFNKQHENRCNSFLKWILESEDSINQFKKEKLLFNSICVETFCRKLWLKEERHYLFGPPYDCEILEQFSTFCDLTTEKIARLKKTLRKNIGKMFLSYHDEKIDFSVLEYLVNWASNSDVQKRGAIKKLIKSVGIVTLWDGISFANRNDLIQFYNEWIIKSPNIAILKKEILSRNDFPDERYKEQQKKIFQKLEKGQKIDLEDVKYFKKNSRDDDSEEDEYDGDINYFIPSDYDSDSDDVDNYSYDSDGFGGFVFF